MFGWIKDIAGPVLGGVASLLGQKSANDTNVQLSREAADFNAREAEKNRSYQTEMSNSAYQRAMADMSKAGLNPMLAYSQGGASTPSGSSGSMAAARVEDALGKGVASAVETRRLKKELDATDSQISLNKAAEEAKVADKLLSQNSAKVAEKNAQVIDAELPAIRQKAKFEMKRDAINERMAPADAILNRTHLASGIANNAMSALRPGFKINGWKDGARPKLGDMLINKKGEILRGF